MAYSQQQQNDYIDKTAQDAKDEADRVAALDKQAVADETTKEIREQAEYDVQQAQNDAQK